MNSKIKNKKLNNKYINYLTLKNYNNDILLYNIFKKNNNFIINELKKKFISTKEMNIIGKGISAKYISNGIGVNQSIIFTNKEFLFLNDYVSFFGIEEYIKEIKYLFIPDYPHDGSKPQNDFNYINIFKYLKTYNFSGKIFIYQIETTLSNKTLDEFKFNSCCSIDIPIYFFNKFINIKKFNLYGIGTSNLYHKDLLNIDFTNTKNNEEMKLIFNNYILNYLKNFNTSLTQYDSDTITQINKYLNDIQQNLNITINIY